MVKALVYNFLHFLYNILLFGKLREKYHIMGTILLPSLKPQLKKLLKVCLFIKYRLHAVSCYIGKTTRQASPPFAFYSERAAKQQASGFIFQEQRLLHKIVNYPPSTHILPAFFCAVTENPVVMTTIARALEFNLKDLK